jgi:acetyl esterase/lipase
MAAGRRGAALQFLRSKAAEWSINRQHIGASGGSAGACSSLWLALHEDMAQPDSPDPVARESTRLRCAALVGAQTSLDPKVMREWMPNIRYGGQAFGFREKLHAAGRLNADQERMLADHRLPEELYDLETDPFEFQNLAGLSEHRATLERLREEMDRWIRETGDQGSVPEDPAVRAAELQSYENAVKKLEERRKH